MSFNQILTLVVICNILWYCMKFIVRSKGYPVSWFVRHEHGRDFGNMKEIIRQEQSQLVKVVYYGIYYGVYGTLIIAFVGFTFRIYHH